MRRKSESEKQEYGRFDFLTDIDPERLKLIGAILLAWNWIEATLDTCLTISLGLHRNIRVDVTTRINGLDGKIEILKNALTLDGQPSFSDDEVETIRRAIGAITANKGYRDGVAHARIISPQELIADTSQRRGKVDEVLVSREALDWLYEMLSHVVMEMDNVSNALFFRHLLNDPTVPDSMKTRSSEWLGKSLVLLREIQTKRLSLPPPPKFPETLQVPQATEAAQAPTG